MNLVDQLMDTGVPGVRFQLPSLRPVIVDQELADRVLADQDAGHRVVVLIALGRFADAAEVVAESRLMDPSNPRLRLLDTEVTRWNGDTERAINRLRRLQEEFSGTTTEADVLQQLGADFYTQGDVKAAATRFRGAWEGREAAGADPRLIECARRSYELVQLELESA